MVCNSRRDSIILKTACYICKPRADSMMFTSEWIDNVIELLKKEKKEMRIWREMKEEVDREIDRLVGQCCEKEKEKNSFSWRSTHIE